MTARPARVLLVEITHDGTFGGSYQAVHDLALNLDTSRYVPVVLFYQDNPFVAPLREAGVEVIVWEDVWQREHGTKRRWFSPFRLVGVPATILRRAALIRRERIDLVHINNSPSFSYYDWLPAARITHTRIVTHLRGELYPIAHPIARWVSRRFDRYVAISDYVTSLLRAAHFPARALVQVEDGIDVERVRAAARRTREETRAALRVPDDAVLAVMAGHLRQWKGQDVVLRAIAALPPAARARLHVLFAGADDPQDTAYRRHLDDLVSEHGLGSVVQFLGPRRDVPDLMHASDLVVHASTMPEPFGLVVLEGLAHGRAVIATAHGGPVQVLGDGSGWLFDHTRPDRLADLLNKFICEPHARPSTTRARARADDFSIRRTALRVQKIWDGVLRVPRTANERTAPRLEVQHTEAGP